MNNGLKSKNSGNKEHAHLLFSWFAYPLSGLRKLVEYPDRRIKTIVYSMTSGGFRLGAWDYLCWKHVFPIKDDEGDVIAAKLVIYSEEQDEYYTFITPEAYFALKE